MLTRTQRELIIKQAFAVIAFASIGVLAMIVFFLFREGLPIFQEVRVTDFLFGREWYPTYNPPSYGIWPLIVASAVVTSLACLIAIPLGILAAIYIGELAPPALKEILKTFIELLSGLPSVVLGFFGMVVIAPWLQETFDLPTGLNILNASAILAIMAVPTIASISEDAINAVPREFKEASYALGATKYETIVKVTVPAALSGIATAVILGMSRAIGETMVVLMVAGGVGEAPFGSGHYHALFATGIVLFFVTLVFNLIADYISRRFKEVGSATL
ncbi:MAG: phosphate ABC transporter permease subunit PstC [Syntrophales bacterium]|nr:phosphate ABC transporter permease subunit PstC [Syntrophales bacterium]